MHVFRGTSTPSPLLGLNGDLFFDTLAGKIYVKQEFNTWELLITSASSSSPGAPVWTKYTVGFAALATADVTNDIELFSLPAKSMILGMFAKSTDSFTGGNISAYGVSIGYEGALTHFLGLYDVFAAPGDENFLFNTLPVDVFDFGSPTSIRIAATSVDDNLDQATAGSVDIYVQTSALPA